MQNKFRAETFAVFVELEKSLNDINQMTNHVQRFQKYQQTKLENAMKKSVR